jgi:hypothetical protein
MRAHCIVALLASGCDLVFGAKPLAPPSDAASLDAVPDAPPDAPPDARTCQPQLIHDDFTGTSLCDGWGTPTGLAAMEGGGMLAITPVASTPGSQGGCFSSTPVAFGPDGVFLQVTTIVNEADNNGSGGTFIFFQTRSPTPGNGVTLNMSVGGSMLSVQAGSTTAAAPYDPIAMRWWRIRPVPELPAVVGEVSPDGLTWQTILSAPGPVPTSVTLEFTSGEYGNGVPAPGTTTIEGFNICP